jgi:hypothetical protein
MQEKVREVRVHAGERATGTYREAMAVELANGTFATTGIGESEPAALAIRTFEDNIWDSGSPLKYGLAEVLPLNASKEMVLEALNRHESDNTSAVPVTNSLLHLLSLPKMEPGA